MSDFLSGLFTIFVIGLNAMAFMFGVMTVVYMLLHWS